MDQTAAVDIYCERTAVGFRNQPVNALSNAAFLQAFLLAALWEAIRAALWAAVEARHRGLNHWSPWLLFGLGALAGVGSSLFHTFANRGSELADTLPIGTFVAVTVLAAMPWVGGMAPRKVAVWAGLILLAGMTMAVLTSLEGGGAAVVATPADTDPLNGSGQYAPAFAALVVFSGMTWRRQHPCGARVWVAMAAFLLALAARTPDMAVCAAFPTGRHILWHLVNAVMIAVLLHLLLRVMDARRRASG